MKPCVDHVTLNVNSMHMNGMRGTMNGKISNGNMYKGVAVDDDDDLDHICNGGDKILKPYSEPKDSIQGRNLPDLPSSSVTTGIAMLKVYSYTVYSSQSSKLRYIFGGNSDIISYIYP